MANVNTVTRVLIGVVLTGGLAGTYVLNKLNPSDSSFQEVNFETVEVEKEAVPQVHFGLSGRQVDRTIISAHDNENVGKTQTANAQAKATVANKTQAQDKTKKKKKKNKFEVQVVETGKDDKLSLDNYAPVSGGVIISKMAKTDLANSNPVDSANANGTQVTGNLTNSTAQMRLMLLENPTPDVVQKFVRQYQSGSISSADYASIMSDMIESKNVMVQQAAVSILQQNTGSTSLYIIISEQNKSVVSSKVKDALQKLEVSYETNAGVEYVMAMLNNSNSAVVQESIHMLVNYVRAQTAWSFNRNSRSNPYMIVINALSNLSKTSSNEAIASAASDAVSSIRSATL